MLRLFVYENVKSNMTNASVITVNESNNVSRLQGCVAIG